MLLRSGLLDAHIARMDRRYRRCSDSGKRVRGSWSNKRGDFMKVIGTAVEIRTYIVEAECDHVEEQTDVLSKASSRRLIGTSMIVTPVAAYSETDSTVD
jgi:hypothetical protein